ncbi:MAG: YdeI/OmpD-associated family protein [Chitinophagaceae bacterium]|nr:YdeI/OmpD-associated family protein [Rubrivivax sp.]
MTDPLFFATAGDFRAWLAVHASTAAAQAVGFYKIGSGQPSMTWPESVDEALSVGWLDGVRRRIDGQSYQIRFTPHKPTSTWSAVNIARVAVLTAEGRMQPAGLKAFALRDEARSRTYAYEQGPTPELTAVEWTAFRRHAAAWAWFESQAPSYRKVVLWWIVRAKQQATRDKRLASLIAASGNGRRL